MRTRFGIDQILAAKTPLRGRIGLVINAAATLATRPGVPTRLALQQASFQLTRLFSPEHGLHALAADGAPVADSLDALTGLPVVSLYGECLQPSHGQLADLDVVLFDIPDIGTRFYTYIWTLWHVLEACAEHGKPLAVLDRPNPLGGRLSDAEGPMLDTENCSSFVGRAEIPLRHSLTAGELALLWNKERSLGVELQVVKSAGWRRSMHWPQTGLAFVPTSPSMPAYESALLYPGLCLFEATNLNPGRGTPLPFQVILAPWLKPAETARHFNSFNLPGVAAEPWHDQAFRPGVRLRIVEAKRIRPVEAGLHLLATVIAVHAASFSWADYPTAANPSGKNHFERLIGRRGIREQLETDPTAASGLFGKLTATPGWERRVKPLLLYK